MRVLALYQSHYMGNEILHILQSFGPLRPHCTFHSANKLLCTQQQVCSLFNIDHRASQFNFVCLVAIGIFLRSRYLSVVLLLLRNILSTFSSSNVDFRFFCLTCLAVIANTKYNYAHTQSTWVVVRTYKHQRVQFKSGMVKDRLFKGQRPNISPLEMKTSPTTLLLFFGISSGRLGSVVVLRCSSWQEKRLTRNGSARIQNPTSSGQLLIS